MRISGGDSIYARRGTVLISEATIALVEGIAAEAERFETPCGDGTMVWRLWGSGRPLVLLHGLGRRWQVFLPLIPALSMRWHIFAPDFRGHGKSGRVVRGYQGTQYSEDVTRFLRERVPANPIVFGHSLGGMVGMWVASHHPELVRALILGDNMIIAERIPTPEDAP